MKRRISNLLRAGGFGLLTALTAQAYAAGYRMEFQSAATLADSGDAAVVEDAGTNWYNSAGLVYLPQQLVFSAIDVYAPTSFSGSVSAPSTLATFGPPVSLFGSNFTAQGGSGSHPNSVLPAFHYSLPVRDRVAVGLSVVPAWGFKEDYGQASILRYNLTSVSTKTIDIAPSIAYQFNDQWSFGIGPDFHYFSVISSSNVRTEGLAPFGTQKDSVSRFSVDSWNYGGHAGILFRMNDRTRVGLNYRSKIVMTMDGFSDFALNGGPLYETKNFKLPIPLPPTTSLSVYHAVTSAWALMGTIAYDQWNVLQNYHARNYIQPPTPSNPTGIIPSVVLPQHMTNTVDFGIGTHYRFNDTWMLRANVKYEPTPTQNQFRGVQFPDGDKLGFQIGGRYTYNKKVSFDALYGHVFVRTMHINDVNPVSNAVATGNQTTSIDLLGAQVVWTI